MYKFSLSHFFAFFALAFGVGLSFGVLGLVDFDAKAPNESSLLTLSLLYGLVPLALKVLAIFALNKYEEK